MTMCGLLIPAGAESKISVFDKILVDIGDEQSIAQNLSTFSSHMVNTIDIMQQADTSTLVLIDELGAGTDPIEGAALAVSIIEYLRQKGAKSPQQPTMPSLKHTHSTPRALQTAVANLMFKRSALHIAF